MLRRLATGFFALAFIALQPLSEQAVRAAYEQAAAAKDDARYDLLITNGRLVDGTGNPWFFGSLAIKGDRIVSISAGSAFDTTGAARVIDAQGMIVAPGFIDVHTHVEGSLGDNPAADNFIRMGVTSIVTGNCGSSAVDVGGYLRQAQSAGMAVNLATLVGHGSVRREVMGEADRAPTPEEAERLQTLVERAMRDGAVGMSTGLIYVPGTYAKTDEIVELARVVGQLGGVYATHMRDEGNGVTEAIAEALTIGEKAKLPVDISHFKVSSKRRWGASRETCELVAAARRRGQQVTVDQYVYTASSTSLSTMLPSWALEGGAAKAKERLEDPPTRQRIKAEMLDNLRRNGFKDFSYAVVSSYRADRSCEGKSISEITRRAHKRATAQDEAEQIIIMYLAGSAGMIFHKMSEADVERILAEPFTMIASDSGVQRLGNGVPHPRGYGNNARVLGHYVRERKLIRLEDAIRKMTSLPAQTFRLWDRGLLRAGMAADVVIFDDAKVSDRATFANPHQYAEGFRYVIVNGSLTIDKGESTRALAGRALWGAARSAAQ